MTGGMHYTPSHTNVSKFFNFQLTLIFSADITLQMLKLCRVTKVKVFFLLLVYVFNCDLYEFSAAILEKGLFYRQVENHYTRRHVCFNAAIKNSESAQNGQIYGKMTGVRLFLFFLLQMFIDFKIFKWKG